MARVSLDYHGHPERAEMIAAFLEKEARELRRYAKLYRALQEGGEENPDALLGNRRVRRPAQNTEPEVIMAAVRDVLSDGRSRTISELLETLSQMGLRTSYSALYAKTKADPVIRRGRRFLWMGDREGEKGS